MSVLKKISAAVLAASLTLSLASCSTNLWGSDISYGAVIEGEKIPAGVFISCQLDAYYDAMGYVDPNAAETTTAAVADPASTETSATTAFTDKVIEGVAVSQWINDKAVVYMQEYVAIEKKFDELGLSFNNNEEEKIEVYLNSFWDYYHDYYENLGISLDSLRLKYLNAAKRDLIFDYYYAANGTTPISDDEVKAHIYETSAKINYIDMQLKDGAGNMLKSDGKAEIKKMAEGYIERAKKGEDFNTILKEYKDYFSKLTADATTAAGTDTVADVNGGAAAEEAAPDNTVNITKDSPYPVQSIVDKVFDGSVKIGDTFLIEDEEFYYVVKFEDILDDGTYLETNADSVRHELKDEEFNATISGWAAEQTNVERNEAAIKAYKISKFVDAQ